MRRLSATSWQHNIYNAIAEIYMFLSAEPWTQMYMQNKSMMIFDIIKQVWLELSNRAGYKTELPLDDVTQDKGG